MEEIEVRYDGAVPQRLDHFLAEALPRYSRSRLQALVKESLVSIRGEPARKAGKMIEPGTVVSVSVPPLAATDLLAEAIHLDIMFENPDVLVVNKPAGMVVHPGAGHASGTLVNAALAHDNGLAGVGGEIRPGVVHRLDKDTSGLLVLAKHDRSLQWLQDQFQAREVGKAYIALLDGEPPTPAGRIQAPIGRDPAHRKKMSIRPGGKGREATTEYEVRESFERHTLVDVRPLTGRTHQIRLHMAFLGCPVAGDIVYGRRRPTIPIGRHFLHAWKLKVVLPGEREQREFVAPLPAELEAVLDQLRAEAGAKH